jgi:formate hydrogenlyase transcriptional activator
VPLISHDRALGTLDVLSFREDAFSEEDAELLGQIGQQIAIAVENALNFERARVAEQQANRQSERLQLLLTINNAVAVHLDLRSLMKTISSCLRNVLDYDIVGLALYDPEIDQLRAYAFDFPDGRSFIEDGQPFPPEGSVSGLAFTSGQPVLIGGFEKERFPSSFTAPFRAAGVKSGGSVPVISRGKKLGSLGVANFRADSFSQEDVELLSQVANQIAVTVENALAFREIEALKNQLNEEKLYLEDEIRSEHNFEEIIGASSTLKRILKQVETVAPTDSAVLIRGETGTGKELIARAIHSLSARRERTLVKLNCAAIPSGLLESELFGHEKGAFTGAIAQRIGRFELAHKGTLFLDEVGDIPLELQPKLLRVLQEQEFERLGSARTQRVDVRLVAATNCDLEQMVADKQFRSDLFYRLNVFPITIPPLRERREDIPLLVRSFAQRFAHRMKKKIDRIPTEAMTALTQYHWPGNVRELENLIERAVILSPGSELEVSVAELKPAASAPADNSSALTLEAAEREHILRVLRETDWVVSGPSGAAARLGMNRTTLQSRMRKLGIARPK